MATETAIPPTRGWNTTAVKGFVVTVAAVAGFLFTHRRRLDILYEFGIHELPAYVPLVAALVVLAVAGVALWRSPTVGPHLRIAAAAAPRWSAPAAVLLIVVSVAAVMIVERWRYKVYSEVEHQQAVMQALETGNVIAARTQCESYFARYPQRRERAAIPDPVCTQLLALSRDLGALRNYVSNQPPRREVVRIQGIGVPFGWGTRGRAIPLLDQLSGGAPKSQP